MSDSVIYTEKIQPTIVTGANYPGLSRSLKFPAGDSTDPTLPAIANRANKYAIFDAQGKPGAADLVSSANGYQVSTSPLAGALAQYDSQGVLGGTAKTVPDLATLKTLNGSAGQVIYLAQEGRQGNFAWVAGDQSANVTADPQNGIWVPGTDGTGVAGAWKRQYSGPLRVEWFGAIQNESTPVDNTEAFKAALSYKPLVDDARRVDIQFPVGLHKITSELQLSAYQRLIGDGYGATLIFAHTGVAIRIGTTDASGTPYSYSASLQSFTVRPDSATHPALIVKIEDVSPNTLIREVSFEGAKAQIALIENYNAYGLHIDNCQFRYCSADDGALVLRNAANETQFSYLVKVTACDFTGTRKYSVASTRGTQIYMVGGQLAIRDTVIQDHDTGVHVGDGTQYYPKLELDNVYFEYSVGRHIKAVGIGDKAPLISMYGCRLNHGAGGTLELGRARVSISSLQETGTANWTAERALIGFIGEPPPNLASFKAANGIRITTPRRQDFSGGAGVSYELYGINVNDQGSTLVTLTHSNSSGDATTSEHFLIRHGAFIYDGSGAFEAVSLGRSVGVGGSNGTWTFTAAADGTLSCSFSTIGTWVAKIQGG